MFQEPEITTRQELGEHELLAGIAECSKNTRRVFVTYFGICIYGMASVIGTQDYQLAMNEQIRLPIANLNVHTGQFLFAFPLVTFIAYYYFHLYLHRLQEMKALLLRGFGAQHRLRLYPWMLNIAEQPDAGFIGRLQILAVELTVWWSLPVTMTVAAVWLMKRHGSILVYALSFVPFLSFCIVMWFRHHYGILVLPTQHRKIRRGYLPEWMQRYALNLSIAGLFSLVLASAGFQANRGLPHPLLGKHLLLQLNDRDLAADSPISSRAQYWLSFRKQHLEGADLTNAVLTRADVRRTNLTRASMNSCTVDSSTFESAKLYAADLSHGIFSRSDFGGVDMRRADMSGAVFRNSDFSGADLSRCVFDDCSFDSTHMRKVRIQASSFIKAKFNSVVFDTFAITDCHFQNVIFQNGQLNELLIVSCSLDTVVFADVEIFKPPLISGNRGVARFANCTFKHCDLTGYARSDTALTIAVIGGKFEDCNLSGLDLRMADVPTSNFTAMKMVNTDLTGANLGATHFEGANLTSARLCSTYLVDAVFKGAIMEGTDLTYANAGQADLTGAIALTVNQLSKARTLYHARLDRSIQDSIAAMYPALLEKPPFAPFDRL